MPDFCFHRREAIQDQESASKAPTIKFLTDHPSENDFFGSHSRVAAAIADVIRDTDSVNVVGLLGGWGSGKSTVVRQVEKSLETRAGTIQTHLFTYDAWLHQNDPPRRAFLEALIGNLTAQKLIKKEDWEPRLADLTGRSEETTTETTRSLSETGKWIFLSLALVPLGLGFLNFDLVSKAFGPTPTDLERLMFWLSLALTAAPLLVIAFFYFRWRAWKAAFAEHGWRKFLFRKKLWLEHDKAHKNESILALLTNQSVERTENKTKISPDPTAIEFRVVFRDLLTSLQTHEKRLVIVVDNLDRLAEADAMQLWATIRSLFLGGEASIETEAGLRPPAIVLPIDESAIARMFSIDHPEQADRLAAAFIDKTFDIAFHVNEPVMSDWRAYLSDKLCEAFGAAMTPEKVYWATRFVEEKFAEAKKDGKITPRKLVKLVNSTAALAVQWGDSIDFTVMILYALHRHDISTDVVAFVRDDPGREAAAEDWRRQIVALHFGVAPEKAFQVLLHEPLRSAIGAMDRGGFDRLVQVEGAWAIVEEIVDQPPADAGGSKLEAGFVANAALLVAAASRAEEFPARRALERLSRIWLDTGTIGAMRSDFAEIVTSMASALTTHTVSAFLGASTQKLGAALSVSVNDESVTSAFLLALDALEAVAKEHDVSLPGVPLTLETQGLFELLAKLPQSHRRHIRTNKTAAELGSALTEAFADENASSNVHWAVRALITRDTITFKDRGKIDWDSVANAAGTIIQENELSHHATGPAIDVLGMLHASNQNAKNLVATMFDQGRLSELLDEADSTDDTSRLADLATLMLLRGADFDGPNGKSWDQVLENRENFADDVDKALAWYRPSQRAMVALNSSAKAPSFIAVIWELARLDVTNNESAHVTTPYLLANLSTMTENLGDELLTRCIGHVAKREDFWPALGKLETSTAYNEAVRRLNMVEEVDRSRLIAEIRLRLESADQGTWSLAVQQGSAPYDLAQIYRTDFDQKSLGGDSLTLSLTETRSDLLTSDGTLRDRWFALAALVSRNVRTTMLRSLRDSLLAGAEVAELDNLIATGGEMLMTAGKFGDEPDKTARHIVLPLVSRESGRQVLHSRISFFGSVVLKSEPDTKAAIVEALDAVADGDEAQSRSAAELKRALGLS